MTAPSSTVIESKGNVLVVDDESDIRESLEVLLGSEGYAVDLAQNATKWSRAATTWCCWT